MSSYQRSSQDLSLHRPTGLCGLQLRGLLNFFYSLLVTSLGGNLTVAMKAAFFSGTGTEQGC